MQQVACLCVLSCCPRFILLWDYCLPKHRRSVGYHYTIILARLEGFRQNKHPLPKQTLEPRREQRSPEGEVETAHMSHLPLVRTGEGKLYIWSPNMQWEETPLTFPIIVGDGAQFIWMETTLICSDCACYAGRGSGKHGSSKCVKSIPVEYC